MPTPLLNIEAILKCSGAENTFNIHATSKNTLQQFYFSETDVDVADEPLLRENIQYFLSMKGDIQQRRICFLSFNAATKTYRAFLVELKDPDIHVVNEIKDAITSSQEIIGSTHLRETFKKLYKTTHCMVIDEKNSVDSSFSMARTAYANSKLTFQKMPVVNDELNRRIIFADCLLQFLEKGQIGTINVVEAARSQLQMCIPYVNNLLIDLSKNNPSVYTKIINNLHRAFCYSRLNEFYQKFSRTAHTLDQLKIFEEQYQLFKLTLYAGKRASQQIYLSHLDLREILQIIAQQDSNQIVNLTHAICETRLKFIERHELSIGNRIANHKKHWEIYLPWLGRNTLNTVYNTTLIGLGVELGAWIGTANLFSVTNQQITAKFLKITGGALGLLATYLGGSYQLFKILAAYTLSQQLCNQLNQRFTDNQTATTSRYLPSLVLTINLAYLCFAFFEASYSGESRHLLLALGGTLGALFSRFVFSTFMPTNQEEINLNQFYLLLLISLFGREIGSWIADESYQHYNLFQLCLGAKQRFENAAEQSDLVAWTAECTQSSNPFSFWARKNNLDVTWRTRDKTGYYAMQCTIISNPDNSETGLGVCDSTDYFETLALPRIPS